MFSSSILLVVTATKDPASLPSRVSDICLIV
jgi:palmitoyltransferase ZDHHC9/14/18